jgi:hypothetical protein
MEEKNAIKETGSVLISLDEASVWCESLLFLLIHESVCAELCADLPLPYIFMEDGWIILLMFNSSVIILRAHQWSCYTISRTLAIVSPFRKAEGCPCLGSSRRSLSPSLNNLNH